MYKLQWSPGPCWHCSRKTIQEQSDFPKVAQYVSGRDGTPAPRPPMGWGSTIPHRPHTPQTRRQPLMNPLSERSSVQRKRMEAQEPSAQERVRWSENVLLVQARPGQQLVYRRAPWRISSIHFHHSNTKIPRYQTALSEGPAGLQSSLLCF